MEVTNEQKEILYTKLLMVMISSLENGTLSSDNLPVMAGYLLDGLNSVDTKEQLAQFLIKLATDWPIFHTLCTIEVGGLNQHQEAQEAQKVLELTRSGKVDEALSLIQRIKKKLWQL